MFKTGVVSMLLMLSFVVPASVTAHFGMLIPSDSMVMQGDERRIDLRLSFSHPFEAVGMGLAKPKQFMLRADGQTRELSTGLTPIKQWGHPAWQAQYRIQRPGIHIFYMEPQPYWEPAEDCFIVHHTKTVVAAFGDDENWEAPLGVKTEIVPVAKPFGQYAGNVFQGRVILDGRPVAGAKVEVEFYNEYRKVQAPTDFMITQTVQADPNGIFTYAAPAAGWWGFAALNRADYTLKHEGVEKEVELGAVIWVKFHNWGK